MKNTKNVLITGVALTIALFISVQVTAMEPKQPERTVNPKLNQAQIDILKHRINVFKENAKYHRKENEREAAKIYKEYIKEAEEVLYGDESPVYYNARRLGYKV